MFYKRGLVSSEARDAKIIELCLAAGQPEPEFVEQAGAVGVHFFRVGTSLLIVWGFDLTVRQREIMQILAIHEPAPLRVIMQRLSETAFRRGGAIGSDTTSFGCLDQR